MRLVLLALVASIAPSTAIDFKQWKTCKECVDAGYGWCPIKRVCGGFANTNCGEGERYWSADYGKELLEKEGGKKKVKLVKDKDLPDVIPLVKGNFTEAVEKSNGIWLVEFYAPWCGHCKKLAPEFAKAAKILRGIVRLAAVDADAELDLASAHDISSYPTVKVFAKDKLNPTPYDGRLTADGIVEWAKDTIKATLSDATGEPIEGRKEAEPKSGSEVVEPIADVEPEKETPKKEEKVEEKPKEEKKAKKKKKKKKKKGAPGSGKYVEGLKAGDLDKVKGSKQLWMVHFYEPKDAACKALAGTWDAAATAARGLARFAAVDVSKTPIEGYAVGSIHAFPPGKASIEFTSEPNAANLGEFAAQNKPEVTVGELVDAEGLDTCTKDGLCTVVFVPHLTELDASGRTGLLKALAEAANLVSSVSSVMWAAHGSQLPLEANFDIIEPYTLLTVDRTNNLAAVSVAAPAATADDFVAAILSAAPSISFEGLPVTPNGAPWQAGEFAYPGF